MVLPKAGLMNFYWANEYIVNFISLINFGKSMGRRNMDFPAFAKPANVMRHSMIDVQGNLAIDWKQSLLLIEGDCKIKLASIFFSSRWKSPDLLQKILLFFWPQKNDVKKFIEWSVKQPTYGDMHCGSELVLSWVALYCWSEHRWLQA